MFGVKKKPDAPIAERIDTIIGKESSFKGTLSAQGAVRIDGKFSGEIVGQGDIIIGEGGRVDATLEGRNILIAGMVNGNIAASGRLEIASSGQILGDIEASTLIIDEGANLQGKCSTKATQNNRHMDEEDAV